MPPRRTLVAGAAGLVLALAIAGLVALASRSDSSPTLRAAGHRPAPSAHPQVVEPGVGVSVVPGAPDSSAQSPAAGSRSVPRDPEERLARAPAGAAVSPGAPSDAQVRAELRELQGSGHGRAQVMADGQAVAPSGAPLVVRELIAAGNAIARTPYLWGGGHARLYDSGYDCSGSLSFAFIHAGLLDRPIAQGWSTMGDPGPGRWISVYSNPGHVWMTVAGLRFDTSAIHLAGSRWTSEPRPTAGFVVRHLPGL
jgi:cell wall-associated NlpC family hydrolase